MCAKGKSRKILPDIVPFPLPEKKTYIYERCSSWVGSDFRSCRTPKTNFECKSCEHHLAQRSLQRAAFRPTQENPTIRFRGWFAKIIASSARNVLCRMRVLRAALSSCSGLLGAPIIMDHSTIEKRECSSLYMMNGPIMSVLTECEKVYPVYHHEWKLRNREARTRTDKK